MLHFVSYQVSRYKSLRQRYAHTHLDAALPAGALRRARRKLAWRFWREFLPLVPHIARGMQRNDPDLPRRVKEALRLGHGGGPHTRGPVLDARFLRNASTTGHGARDTITPPSPISVILPVYNAFELLDEALSRLRDHTDLPCHLVIIEDCSPDPRVRPWLRDWVAAHRAQITVTLLENSENLGFIGSVNRGFLQIEQESIAGPDSGPDFGPVILLNSDAMVPEGWASRLVAPLARPEVASATPLSNDAEIFGAPVLCQPTALHTGQGDHIDALLRRSIAADAPQVSAPTGVGFCMALGRQWLRRVGWFDTVFGRGYGEEVDWCRRAAALGGLHVAVPQLFVEHRGGASFGPEKLALIRQNNSVIARRYQGYDQLVQDFIHTDPLATPRLLAALAWADSLAQARDLPVFIAHSMGGGAEHYLQDQLHTFSAAIVLRFGGSARCRIEVHSAQGCTTAGTDDLALVARMLGAVTRRRIVYSCAAGDPDLGQLPEFLVQLAQSAPLDVLFHDYLPISPSYTLLDQGGTYRGVPHSDDTDPAHRHRQRDGTSMPLQAWRESWGAALRAARRLVVFSDASRAIVAQAYPDVAGKITLIPHQLAQMPQATPCAAGQPVVIGILGAIGPQKGAAVVAALARATRSEPEIKLALIGTIAPGHDVGGDVVVHGPYAREDIAALAERYGVTHWLIPSVWPETFCYTVHEGLATGLPTLAFDLGAQGDAVRGAPNGWLVPSETEENDATELAARALATVRALAQGQA